jgi:hypothetical protein
MVNPDTATTAAQAPADFRRAVAGLSGRGLRSGTELAELPAPARLAPWSHAVAISVAGEDGDEVASGRLVLLHDPAGVPAWDGTLRIVVFGTCEVDADMASDPLLADVAWSWLTERLAAHQVGYTALGGTVTTTSSTRFGDIAGPARTEELELRASWTAADPDTGPHLVAFADFLATAAGLPPEGVASLRDQRHPFANKIS